MLELRPTEVVRGVEPRPKILLVDQWVRFSPNFPSSLDHVRGKTARITKQQQVPYELSYILKEGCYKDVNLSNEDTGEKLYPDLSFVLYEMLIGFKPGNFLCHLYFPADSPVYRLDYATMLPQVNSTSNKYLGAIKPEESPDTDPVMKLYLVYKLNPIFLRLVVDEGIDYEKATLKLTINRCVMNFAAGDPPPHIMPKPILYLDEISDMKQK